MANITLQLKAKHFKGTEFNGWESNCAIEKSYKDLTGNKSSESVIVIVDLVTEKEYDHDDYLYEMFLSDTIKAQSHNFDETVIREIELIEI